MTNVELLTFILALVGALAWIPPVIEWRRKPDVHIASAEQLEASYLAFGGVLNVPSTFASFDKAALIESISLQLTHEDGTRLGMYCVGLLETTTAQSSSGEKVLWNRETRGHVLLIPKDQAVERLVMFRDRAQQDAVLQHYERVVPLYERLRATEGDAWRDAMRRAQEFHDYVELVQNGISWRRGRYAAVITANVKQLSEPVLHAFEFDLSDADLRVILSNRATLNDYVMNTLLEIESTVPPSIFAFPRRHLS